MKRYKLLASFQREEYQEAKKEWKHLADTLTHLVQPGRLAVRMYLEPDGYHIYLYKRVSE